MRNNDVYVMAAPTTVDQTRAPIPIRLLNRCGAALEKIGIRSTSPSAGELIERAKRRCDLEDFGSGDFFEPLSRLLGSCHREARLNVIGKMALRSDAVRILCNRLLLVRDRRIILRSRIKKSASHYSLLACHEAERLCYTFSSPPILRTERR